MSTSTTPGSSLLGTVVLAAALSIAGCAPDTPQSRAAAGKELLQKKDYKGAVVQFKSALQLDPASAEGRFLLGQALLEAGDPIGAVVELTRALKSNYPADKVLPVLARALVVNGEEKKLTNLYGDTTLEDKPAMAALKSKVAAAWLGQRNPAKADAAIAAALAAVPEYGPALTLSARRLGEQRRFDEALALIEKIVARDPSLHEAWALKGEIALTARGDVKGADEAFRKALAIEPAYLPAHLSMIAVRLSQSDLAGAKAQADRLRSVLPKHPQMMFVDAQLAYIAKEFTKARELVQLLMRLSPEDLGILQLAGAVEGQLGSLVLAETFFNKALAINPELALARRNLAQIYLRLGQANRALSTLKPLLGNDVTSADAQALAGDAFLRLGDTRAAEAAFNRALKLSPDDQRAATMLALSQLGRGDSTGAFAELTSLSARGPELFADQAQVSARLRRGELDAALAAVNTMVKKAPANAQAHELLGRVQIARKDFPAARAALEQARKLDPALFAATAALSAIDMIEKKPEQAQKRLEDSIKVDPKSPYPRQALAELRLRNGGTADEVKTILTDAIKAAPTDVDLRLQLIDVTLRKRQYKEALAAAQDAAAAMPNDTRVLEAMGRAQMEAGNVEQAVNTYRRLIGLDPKSALAYMRLADIYQATGKPREAEVVLKRALDVQPELVPAQAALMQVLMKSNQTAQALAFALKLQKDRPTNYSGYVLEAAYHVKLKATDAAIGAYRKGLARNPGNSDMGVGLYKLLRESGRTAETDSFGEAWMKAHPKDIAFEYQTANTQLLRSEFDKATVILQRVLGRFPNHPLALNNMAWMLAVLGKPGAVAYAQKAVDAMPGQPALMDTLAMALAADKQTAEALAVQKRAVEISPKNDALRLNLAKIAIQAGDMALARTELQRLQSMGARFELQDEVTKLMKSL